MAFGVNARTKLISSINRIYREDFMNQVQHWPGLRIDVTANGYAIREVVSLQDDRSATIAETHVFESFEGLVAHIRNRLPIYPALNVQPAPAARKR
jgi:hypothetical protein